jgi:hypothetical protein
MPGRLGGVTEPRDRPRRGPASLRQRHPSPPRQGVSLLIDCGGWLHRDDFTSQFVTTAADASDGGTLMAAIDWQAAIAALDHGRLSGSSGERHALKLVPWPVTFALFPAGPARPRFWASQ